jgi:hypothetical protein
MINVLVLLIASGLLAYLLFGRDRSGRALISASRWLLLTWGVMGLFMLTSPLSFRLLGVSSRTAVYVIAWICLFLFGDRIGSSGLGRGRTVAKGEEFGDQPGMVQVCNLIILQAVLGAIIWAAIMLRSAQLNPEAAVLSQLRSALGRSEGSVLGTLAQFMAFGGLPCALYLLARAIAVDEKPPILAWAGLLTPLSVYLVGAGRQGFVLTGVSALVTIAFSLRRRRSPYRFPSALYGPVVAGIVFSLLYFAANVRTRSTAGLTMDDKLMMIDRVYGIRVDSNFRDQMRGLGAVGDGITELYFYFSTQMPGLDATLSGYEGPHGYGLEQIPYITRRIESIADRQILEPIFQADDDVFGRLGLPANFFRSAVHSNFLSFGWVGGLLAVLIGGFFSGLARRAVLMEYNAFGLAVQGMVCSGAAFTVIFSPFIEAGWAFPMMWIALLGFLGAARRDWREQASPAA